MVASFQPVTPDSAGLAALLPAMLEDELERDPDLALRRLEGIPPLAGEFDIQLYLETCPAGEHVGCSFVVAQHAGVRFAVAGTVDAGEVVVVGLSLVDVEQAREAVSLTLAVPVGEDRAFAEQVGQLLGALMRGELGQLEDIRFSEVEQPDDERRQQVEQELQILSQEGPVEFQLDLLSAGLGVEQPVFTPADLLRARLDDAPAEWERLGMSGKEYMRYRNSGMDLLTWRRRRSGRALQLLLRPSLGFLWGPVVTRYHGRFAMDLSEDDPIVESYGWQALESGTGFSAGLDLGFGLTPSLELEAGLAAISGRYLALVQQEEVFEPVIPEPENEDGAWSLCFAGGLRLAPLPVSAARPVLGVAALLWRGSGVEDHFALPVEELPRFSAPVLVGARVQPGVELRLSQRADLFAQLPLMVLVGQAREVYDEEGTSLQEKPVAPEFKPLALGLQAGVQVRLGGRDPEKQAERGRNEEDEESLEELE